MNEKQVKKKIEDCVKVIKKDLNEIETAEVGVICAFIFANLLEPLPKDKLEETYNMFARVNNNLKEILEKGEYK